MDQLRLACVLRLTIIALMTNEGRYPRESATLMKCLVLLQKIKMPITNILAKNYILIEWMHTRHFTYQVDTFAFIV